MVNQIQSRPSRPDKHALRGGEDPFDEDLLSSLGLSREDIEGDAVGEAVEDDVGGDEPEGQHTKLKVHEQGLVQAGVMAGAVGVVVLLGGVFLSSSFGIGTGQSDKRAEVGQESAASRGFVGTSEEDRDKELYELRAKQAVLQQQYQIRENELRRQQQLAVQVPADGQVKADGDEQSAKDDLSLSSRRGSSGDPVVMPPPPPPVVTPPATPTVALSPPPDPIVQWQKAQELWRLQQEVGSFPKRSSQVLQNQLESQPSVYQGISPEVQGSVPAEGQNDSSQGQPVASSPPSQGAPTAKVDLAKNALDERVIAEQQAFLAGKIYEPVAATPTPATARIMAGTQALGRVKSPIIFVDGDEKAGGRHFTIELEEPIHAGAVTIPSKTLLLGRVALVADNGVMFLAGTLLVLPDGSEYELPEDVVEIRGSHGNPLIASRINPERGSNFFKAVGSMMVGGAQEAARLFNQPRQQQTIIGERQTIVTTSQPKPNYPAAVVSGAMNAISPRLQQTLQPTNPQGQVRAWSVNAGRKVSVFFNRSVTLEMPERSVQDSPPSTAWGWIAPLN